MSDKMTIKKAKKVIKKYGVILDWDDGEQECLFHKAGVPTKAGAIDARGFIKGYESRDAEMAELKAHNERMREALEKIRDSYGDTYKPWDVAQEALKGDSN